MERRVRLQSFRENADLQPTSSQAFPGSFTNVPIESGCMNDFTGVFSLLNLLGLGGLAWFIYYVIKGLRERIQALTQLAEEQRHTLDVVRTRAVELDQLRKDYRQALDDFQDIGHKLEERRNAVIRELESANKQKDDELARLKTLELEEIELRKKSYERLPQLEERLSSTVEELQRQIRLVAEGTGTSASSRTRYFSWLMSGLYDPGSFRKIAEGYYLESDYAALYLMKLLREAYVRKADTTKTQQPVNDSETLEKKGKQ